MPDLCLLAIMLLVRKSLKRYNLHIVKLHVHKILAFRGCQFGRLGPEDFSEDIKERNTLGSFHGRYHISLKIHSLLRDLLIKMLKQEMTSGKKISEGKFPGSKADIRL